MRVAIAANGVVSPYGAGAAELWRGVLSGETAVAPHPELRLPGPVPQGASPQVTHPCAARVPDAALEGVGDPRGDALDRTEAMLRAAAAQIVASPAWERAAADPERLGVCVGTTQGPIVSWSRHQQRLRDDPHHVPPAPGLEGPTLALARALGARGPVSCPSMACATSTAAIGMGLQWIRAGECDAVVAGGADAVSVLVHQGFACLRALDPELPRPFDRDRAGLGVGEAAGLVLLTRGDVAGPDAARVAGWGLSSDANHLTGPDPTGSGVARAVEQALADAGLGPAQVDAVNAHGTATVFNDRMEGQALRRVFGARAGQVPVDSIKGAIGHTMAAAGVVEAILCAEVLRSGQLPATTGLRVPDPEIPLDLVQGAARAGDYRHVVSTSSGFGGVNAALVLVRARP